MIRAALVLALLAQPALALDPASCVWEETGDGGSVVASAPVDMGGGMVAHYWGAAADNGSGFFHIHEVTRFALCGTGRAVEVPGAHDPRPGLPLTDVAALVLDAIASPEPVTLGEVADRLDAIGWGASVVEAGPEDRCGCDVFYPDLGEASR